MKSILLGVSGSIACYKAVPLVRLLRQRGFTVQVMMTAAATRLVGAPTFRAISGQAVITDEWQSPQTPDGMDHITAVRAADIFLVAPATADFLAKAAHGIADNTLLSAWLAADCRRIVAPAMNQQMWKASATQNNIGKLAADGVEFLGPDDGEQACGESGGGRLLEPQAIADALTDAPLAGRRVVVSTGATVESLDAMRIISNRSSGRMGFAVAQVANELGAETTIIAGQTTVPPPPAIALQRAADGEAMRRAVLAATDKADWFFAVAAVADFRPAVAAGGKPARQDGDITIQLSPTADILAEVAQARPGLRCVGFAAQSGDRAEMKAQARAKMARKGLHWLVLNDVADADRADCQLTLLYNDGEKELPRLPKMEAARRLFAVLREVSHETGEQK